jgi:hypothetical protein
MSEEKVFELADKKMVNRKNKEITKKDYVNQKTKKRAWRLSQEKK